jgi:hypothetical protein
MVFIWWWFIWPSPCFVSEPTLVPTGQTQVRASCVLEGLLVSEPLRSRTMPAQREPAGVVVATCRYMPHPVSPPKVLKSRGTVPHHARPARARRGGGGHVQVHAPPSLSTQGLEKQGHCD